MPKRERVVCCTCGRQVVSYPASDDRVVGGGHVTLMCAGEVCCHECARDLDENGLFPGEGECYGQQTHAQA